MGASCTITSVCGLAQEARQYTNDENFINKLVLFTKTNYFKQAVESAEKYGSKGINYHKDGTPTYSSVLSILQIQKEDIEKGLNDVPQNELDKLNTDKHFDVATIFKNKLVPIAKNTKSNITKNQEDQSIGNVSLEDALNICFTFNSQNAASEEYIAIYEKENKWSPRSNYKVKIIKNTEENKRIFKDNVPIQAAIQAAIDFFESVGLTVHLDQFNPQIAGGIFQFYSDNLASAQLEKDLQATVSTVISICTNLNSNDVSDLPSQISRNVAVMVAKVFMEAAKNNPEFKESIGYQRLWTSVERYLNTSQSKIKDDATVEKLMESLIADEVQYRINLNIKRKSLENDSYRRMTKYVRQRVKTMFEKIREFFTSKETLIKRWRAEKFQNKDISVRELQRRASRAVNEMFKKERSFLQIEKEQEIEKGLKQTSNPTHRRNIKRYTNQELKEQKSRHTKTQKIIVNIENRLKTHLKLLVSSRYTKESTRFESIIDDLENAFVSTNELGSVSSQKDVASKALTRTVMQLSYELKMLDNDINSLETKLLGMVPDYTNEVYMDLVQQLQTLHSRFQALCEIKDDITNGLSNGLLNPVVRRLGTSGVEESNLKALTDELLVPMNSVKNSLESAIDKVNLDLLEQMVGSDHMDIVIGKMFRIRKEGRGRSHEQYGKYLEELKKEKGYFETRTVLKDQLENPANLRNSLWHKIMGSPQNSSSILNQIAYLAIQRANTEAHNRTQQTLYDITTGRNLYKHVTQRNIIERDINGIPTGNLIRPIDYERYEKELEEAEKIWGKQFAEKYQNRDFTKDQMLVLWKGFRQEKFNEWNEITNENTGKLDFRYKKQSFQVLDPHTGQERTVDMYAPNKEIYKNYTDKETDHSKSKTKEANKKRWDNLTQEEQELSNWFFALKYQSDSKLNNQGSGAHKIPMFKGGMFDTFWGSNVTHLGTLARNTLKRSFLHDIEDYEFGAPKSYVPLSQMGYRDTDDDVNDKIKRIPLYGVRKLDDMKGLSTDLYSSYLAYEDMSNNYAAKSKVELLLQTTATKAFKSLQKNDSSRLGEKTKWFEGHTFRHEFEHLVDKELYGLKKNDITLGTFGIRLAKVMNHIGRITTTLFLGGNIHSSFVNLITGYNEIVKEAGVGEYINKRDLIKSIYNYMHHVQWKKLSPFGNWDWAGIRAGNKDANGFMPYLLRQPADSPGLVNQILRDFDFTERFVQDIRNYTTKNVNKIARNFGLQRLIMLPYEVTDHWMQAVPLMAMLHHEKVYSRRDKDGSFRQLSLMEALYPEYHKFKKGDKKKSYGYRSLVEKPNYIDTGNRFGIFYKTKEDAEKGEDLLKLIKTLTTNIDNYQTKGDYKLQDLVAEDPKYKELFESYGLSVPSTSSIKQFRAARATLIKEFNKLIYNNAELAKFQLKAREVVNRMHGVYDSRSKGAFNRTILGATTLSMKNYAVGLINKRLMQGHYNIILNKWDEGTLVTVAKVLTVGIYDGFRDYKLWGGFQSMLALVSPWMFGQIHEDSKFAFLNMAKHLNSIGFTDSQIRNLKRAKIDALRILFWGILNGIIYGLGSGWIGGYDDDDDEKALSEGQLTEIEKMLKLKGDSLKITRKGIQNGSVFERKQKLDKNGKPMYDENGNPIYEYGPLYSEVTIKDVFIQCVGLNSSEFDNMKNLSDEQLTELARKIPHNNEEEVQFIKEYILPNMDTIFEGYGGKGGVNAQVDKWFTEWCDKDPEHRYVVDKNGDRKRGWGIGKGHSIFPNKFETMMKDALGEGTGKNKKLPKTTMQNLVESSKEVKEKLDNTVIEYENLKTPSTLDKIGNKIGEVTGISDLQYTEKERKIIDKKNQLQKEIVEMQNQLTTIDFIKTGYNKHLASAQISQYKEKEKQLLTEYNVSTIEQLKAKQITTSNNVSDQIAAKQVKQFLESYDETEKRLNNAEKELRSKTFEKAYFKNNHPDLYYWLGVANYFAERALLEQESFIPFADTLARYGGTYISNQLGSLAGRYKDTEFMMKVLPELTHCEPVKPLKGKFNALNEMANLIGLPAAAGSLTSVSDLFSELGNYLFNSQEDYENQLNNLKQLRDSAQNEEDKSEIQYKIDKLQREWEEHHVQNNSAKLRKGQHKVTKLSSFIPFYRTLYMMGFFNYMDNVSLEGGWQASNSFKSFFYKEDKFSK